MSDTSTPAPLTDEQWTDEQIDDLRLEVLITRSLEIRERRLTMLLAAVVARAKRDERERFDSALRAVAGAGYFRAFTEEMNRREVTDDPR